MDLDDIRRMGLPVRETSGLEGKRVKVTEVAIKYLQSPGLQASIIAPDGTNVPLGVPIEELRARFGGNHGTMRDPLGKHHEIVPDPEMPDGKGVRVSVSFTVDHQL